MVVKAIRRMLVAGTALVLAGSQLAPGVLAAGPIHEGPFAWNESFDIPDFCAEAGRSMHVRLDTHGTESFTIWADDDGQVKKVLYRVRAPEDVFTNVDTGRQIVVRGEFQEDIERIPGTDEFTKSISGFRYLINEPGSGVVVQEVGRIVYGDLEQTIALWQAGKHDLVYDDDFAVFCDLLDQAP